LLKASVEPEWIDYPTAEKFSGLSHTTIWRYVSTGQLKAARVGRSVRIHLPSLKEFMEKKAVGIVEEKDQSSKERRLHDLGDPLNNHQYLEHESHKHEKG
jgi:excisionase family DNA binding protein